MKTGERVRQHLSSRHERSRNLLRRVPIFHLTEHVDFARGFLERTKDWESINYIYLLDAEQRLKGVLSIKELLRAPGDTVLGSIAKKSVVTVHPAVNPERAAILAIHHRLKTVPVVEPNGRFVGVIGTDEILETLQHAGIDDAIRYSGIHLEHRHLLDVLHGSVGLLIRRRLPWLLLGLGGGMIAALLVGLFEEHLRSMVQLAFFTPAVVYMGDAVGTQVQALFLRAITIGEVRVSKFLVKEVTVDAIIGLIVGIVAFLFSCFAFQNSVIGAIVGISMFVTIATSGVVAILMTLLFSLRKNDPALGSGPFATIIQDLVSLAVYFAVASFLLKL